MDPNSERTPPADLALSSNADLPSFVTIHEFDRRQKKKRQPKEYKLFNDLNEQWNEFRDNRVVFLRGYPSKEWLCQLGAKLNIDYEYLYQHMSTTSQMGVGENFCLPPLSLISSETIQLTFTSIGEWDNHGSRIDLETARVQLSREMKSFTEDLNTGRGVSVCDSIVRNFYLHDLKHYSIEQMITIKLLQFDGFWTCESISTSEFSVLCKLTG